MPRSTWQKVVADRSKDERKAIRTGIRLWSKSGSLGHYTTQNLEHDQFLSESAADDFADIFQDLGITGDLSTFKNEYKRVCADHRLCGQEIGLSPYPQLLGRAENRSSFVLKIIRLTALSRSEVERFIDAWEFQTLDSDQEASLYSLPMSNRNIWVTWDETSKGIGRPFAALRSKSSYDLRMALGLPVDADYVMQQPMIVLEYESATVGVLYRPTTADAGLYTRFRVRNPPPPKENDWYGLTIPWQDDPEHRFASDDGTYPPKLPEALHKPILFPPGVVLETYMH